MKLIPINTVHWSYDKKQNILVIQEWVELIASDKKSLKQPLKKKQVCLSAFNTDTALTPNYSSCSDIISNLFILFHYNVVIQPQANQRYTIVCTNKQTPQSLTWTQNYCRVTAVFGWRKISTKCVKINNTDLCKHILRQVLNNDNKK